MNTISIGSVTYNELEVKHYIDNSNKKTEKLNDVNYKVREFFDELEWSNSEATITRCQVNELFSTIGLDHLRGKFKATITVTAYVTDYPATDSDDAGECIADDLTIDIGSSASVEIDNVEVTDIEEED
jgi:hypothetical protein